MENNKTTAEKILNLMQKVKYGWIDKKHHKHLEVDDSYAENYILQSPEEVVENQLGVCWDQVELERYYFSQNGIPTKSYFIVHHDDKKCPTHTFLIFETDGVWYWFEHAWEKFSGLHSYDSENALLNDIKAKFIQSELNDTYDPENLCLYEYSTPRPHIGVSEFYQHCESGKRIKI